MSSAESPYNVPCLELWKVKVEGAVAVCRFCGKTRRGTWKNGSCWEKCGLEEEELAPWKGLSCMG